MQEIDLKTEEKISIVKDPFNKYMVTSVWIHHMSTSPGWSGSIEFKNGDTEGKQKFNEKEFNDLVLKMRHFIDTL